MSEQADIEAALARATAAYKLVSAERDALKDANDRAAAAEAEIDRLREEIEVMILGDRLRAENDRLREALEQIANCDDSYGERRRHTVVLAMLSIARAALAKEAGQSAADKWEEEIQ